MVRAILASGNYSSAKRARAAIAMYLQKGNERFARKSGEGRVEGSDLRCMYHGLKFAPSGQCIEIPGQSIVPPHARVPIRLSKRIVGCGSGWAIQRSPTRP